MENQQDVVARWVVRRLADVARFFRVTEDTCKKWRAVGMPGAARKWNLADIVAWRDGRLRNAGRAAQEGADTSRLEANRRRAWADAEAAETRLAALRGELIEVEYVIREYQHHATHARSLFEQIPTRLMGELPEDATADDKRRFRGRAQRIVDDVVAALHSDLLERGGGPAANRPDDGADQADQAGPGISREIPGVE